MLLQFGKEMCVDAVIHPEVLILWECSLVIAASRWTSSDSFVFESDSKSLVAWVGNSTSAP